MDVGGHRRASSKIFGVAMAGKNRFRYQFLSNYWLFRIFLLWCESVGVGEGWVRVCLDDYKIHTHELILTLSM